LIIAEQEPPEVEDYYSAWYYLNGGSATFTRATVVGATTGACGMIVDGGDLYALRRLEIGGASANNGLLSLESGSITVGDDYNNLPGTVQVGCDGQASFIQNGGDLTIYKDSYDEGGWMTIGKGQWGLYRLAGGTAVIDTEILICPTGNSGDGRFEWFDGPALETPQIRIQEPYGTLAVGFYCDVFCDLLCGGICWS
jgi:hypothetical protein